MSMQRIPCCIRSPPTQLDAVRSLHSRINRPLADCQAEFSDDDKSFVILSLFCSLPGGLDDKGMILSLYPGRSESRRKKRDQVAARSDWIGRIASPFG